MSGKRNEAEEAEAGAPTDGACPAGPSPLLRRALLAFGSRDARRSSGSRKRRRRGRMDTPPPTARMALAFASPFPAAHVAPPLSRVESTAIGDSPILDVEIPIAMGRHTRHTPARCCPLDQVALDHRRDGDAPPPAGRLRLGSVGRAALASFGPRSRKTIHTYLVRWNVFVTEFCDPEGYDPWVFNPTVFELWAGWMYERGGVASVDDWASAFNYVYRAHSLYPPFRDGRIRECKLQFKKAAKARRISEGDVWMRTDIPSRAIQHLLLLYQTAADASSWETCDQMAAVLMLLLFWVRASTFGHSTPGDISLVPGWSHPSLVFTLRKVKRGPQAWAPTTMSIPLTPPSGNAAARVFEIMEETLQRNPRFSGQALGLNFENAAYRMTDWCKLFMPRDAIHLAPGTFIGSQSCRITGATHARVSLNAPWNVIMTWGGWLSATRCQGYIRALPPCAYMAALYWFLSPGQSLAAQGILSSSVRWPRAGYQELEEP